MTSAQRTILGVGLLAAGLLMALVAALIAWRGVERWFAVVELREAYEQLRRGRLEDARKLARKAAVRVPEEPAPALLAIDPADAAALERLVTVAHRADRHADKQACLAGIGLIRLAAGKPADVPLEGAADGRLFEAISAARANRDLGKLLKPVEGEEPPHFAVQQAAHTVLLRRAWQEGHVPEVRSHAGALLLMRPTGPQAAALRFLLVAATPTPDPEVISLAEQIPGERDAVLRAVAALLPQRRAAIAAKWPKAVEGLP